MSERVDRARCLAQILEKLEHVSGADVDDWNDSGYFTLFVRVESSALGEHELEGKWPLQHLTRNIKAAVRASGAYLESIEAPQRQYVQIDGKKYFDTYSTAHYRLSVYIPS